MESVSGRARHLATEAIVILPRVNVVERPEPGGDLDLNDIVATCEHLTHADVSGERQCGWPEITVE